MDQQTPAPDYDFITQAGEQKKGLLLNADKKTRIMIVLGGAGLLLIIGAIFLAIIFGGRTDLSQELLRVAQRQQEIVRVAEIGEDNARSRNTAVFATTTKFAISSSQQSITNRLNNLGVQTPSNLLATRESDATTNELEEANQANEFDEVFQQVILREFATYEQLIRSASEQARGSDLDLLDELLDELEILANNL